jgi:cell division protein ZipA
MTELRWVLLALGVILILGVYLWSRGIPQRWFKPIAGLSRPKVSSQGRVEPEVDILDLEIVADEAESGPEEADGPSGPAESVVTIRLIPNAKKIASDRVILALRAAGLRHGKFGIFHSHADEFTDDPLFSVASLTEPGSFDMSRLSESKIAGMSFFMVLPGIGDPVERFDQMVATARELGRELDCELRDEKGSSWSIQRERYVREEIIEYRHHVDKPMSG